MMDSWLYDKQNLLSVTLTGQYSLLMLIESLELEGIRVIIANTDGIEAIVPEFKVDDYYRICKEWEEITKYELEYDEYERIIMSNVNNYIAVTKSGKVKKKGHFLTEFELFKDKSNRIVGIALENYFIKGIKPEDTIKEHKNIFDFCIRSKATGINYLELQNSDATVTKLGKLMRYYLTTEKDAPQLTKRLVETDRSVHQAAPNELGIRRVKPFNHYFEGEYNIDFEQYIFSTYEIIADVERNKKHINYANQIKPNDQLKLL